MFKKTLAILSAFATLFAFAACDKVGKLEKDDSGKTDTTESVTNVKPTMPIDVTATQLFVEDENGVTVPVVTKVSDDGNIYFEYTDSNGNNVTQSNTDNLIGVTKYSEDDLKELEEQIKDFEKNPDKYKEDEVDFVLSDGLVPEEKFKETTVELDANGKPVRDKAKSYEEIFKKNSFTFKVNAVSVLDGIKTATPMSWCKDGQNMLIEVVAPYDNSTPMKGSILYKDGKCYMIIPSMKMYYQVPDEMAGQMFNPDMFDEILEESEADSNSKYIKSYNVSLNGKNYVCDVFESDTGAINKNYYDSKGAIVRTEIIDGEDYTIWEIIELSDKCDSSIMVVPDKFIDMSAFLE